MPMPHVAPTTAHAASAPAATGRGTAAASNGGDSFSTSLAAALEATPATDPAAVDSMDASPPALDAAATAADATALLANALGNTQSAASTPQVAGSGESRAAQPKSAHGGTRAETATDPAATPMPAIIPAALLPVPTVPAASPPATVSGSDKAGAASAAVTAIDGNRQGQIGGHQTKEAAATPSRAAHASGPEGADQAGQANAAPGTTPGAAIHAATHGTVLAHTEGALAATTANTAMATLTAATPTLAVTQTGMTQTGITLGAAPTASATPTPQQSAASPAVQVAPVMIAMGTSAGGAGHVIVQLSPESLGRVEIRIDRAQDGTASVQVSADRADTLRLLQADAPALSRTLDQAGVPQDGRTVSFHLAPAPETASGQNAGAGQQSPGPFSHQSSSGQTASGQSNGGQSQGGQSQGGQPHGGQSSGNRSSGDQAGRQTAFAEPAAPATPMQFRQLAGINITA